MWRIHHSATNSRIQRVFSFKNLSRFFITPKIKSKRVQKQMICWRECGEANVDHSHNIWKCLKIQRFWEMLHGQLQKMRYQGNVECCIWVIWSLKEGKYTKKTKRYLIKILLTAGKKAITRSWGRVEPPNCEQWIELVDGIFIMEQMTYRLRLQEEQIEKRWWKWTNYKSSNRDIWYGLVIYKNKTCLCKPRCRVCNEDGCHICFVFVYFMLCFVLYCIIVFLFLFIFCKCLWPSFCMSCDLIKIWVIKKK